MWSPELIAEERERIEESYMSIFVPRPRGEAIADAVAARGVRKKVWCIGRADFICADADLVERWVGLGMTNVYIGVEACTDE